LPKKQGYKLSGGRTGEITKKKIQIPQTTELIG
jgi:hypothetical protein